VLIFTVYTYIVCYFNLNIIWKSKVKIKILKNQMRSNQNQSENPPQKNKQHKIKNK